MLDPVRNFCEVTVLQGYNDSATVIALVSGQGSLLPDPSTEGAFNLVWYNATDYSDPSLDPYKEIVRLTARGTDNATIARAQENTIATAKNISGKTYKLLLTPTKKMIDDIGSILTPASSSAPASLDLHEDTDNGTNKITITAPSAIASDKTLTLPDETGTLVTSASANTYADKYQYEGISRQAIINGGFTVNQRAYVSNAVLDSGKYGHDRWKAGASGGDYTFTQLASATQITIKSGKSLIQVVEDKNVVGGSYTLSWEGTAQARFGKDSATPSGAYAVSPITITGQTAGTVMSVEFNEGTLGKVNLNVSSVALPFQPKSYEEELRACLRYGNPGYNIHLYRTTSDASYGGTQPKDVHFQVIMRVTPIPSAPTAGYVTNYSPFGISIWNREAIPSVHGIGTYSTGFLSSEL
jgi:hypothetical protein